MTILKSEQLACFDCDDTLVMHRTIKATDRVVAVTNPHSGEQYYLAVHQPHVRILKERKARGATILVWSQGGWAWAEAVVKALELQDYVDIVCSKPALYVDDKPASQWMEFHTYLKEDSAYK